MTAKQTRERKPSKRKPDMAERTVERIGTMCHCGGVTCEADMVDAIREVLSEGE